MASATEPHEPPLRVTPEADQLGRRIAIHVSASRFGQARRVLGLAIAKVCRPRAVERITSDTSLAALDLPIGTVKLLEAAGIRTV